MFVDVNQCKRVIRAFLDHTGRGGFRTGTVESTSPLRIKLSDKLTLDEDDIYITDNCIGLKQASTVYRQPLRTNEGVLVLCRPSEGDGIKYILLDRIQPYKATREVLE